MIRAPRAERLGPAVCLAAILALAGGCAAKPLYDWGRYEESLQASYIAHDQAQALASLGATLDEAQQRNVRVPPGVCADYGFLLYSSGQGPRAIPYFEREAALYPEAKVLMDRLVAKVRAREAARAAAAAAREVSQ